MTITINGSTGITTPEITLDNTAADGGQVVLKSSGYSNWNIDNYSGRLRGYYGSTEYWTVTASGNVGIGTSSPAAKLEVKGANGNGIQYTSAGGTQTYIGDTGGSASLIGALTNNPLIIYAGAAERARIDSSGNLLVGTTASLYSIPNGVAMSGSGIGAIVVGHANGTGSGNGYINFNYNGSAIGAINQNGTTAVSYNTTSDYRLKENIQPLSGALSRIAALKPCTYTWKNAPDEVGEGFIAHELAEVCPQATTGEKDAVDAEGNPVYQGIDTSFLVATLTAAIQELKAIVDEQAAKITALENK